MAWTNDLTRRILSSPVERKAVPGFEIWKAGPRVVSIDSPVRLQILRALEEKPRTLNHLVAITKKSKPTLSLLHVRPLLEAGLVQEAQDPHDARVKWYKLVGNRIGSSSIAPASLRDAVLDYVQASGFVPLRPLLETLDWPALVRGPPKDYAKRVAQRLGQLMGRMLFASTREGAVEELSMILHREGLGSVSLRRGKLEWTAADGASDLLGELVEHALEEWSARVPKRS